jgi:hypothetical protein
MTDTVTIRRDMLERLYEAAGRGTGMENEDLRSVRAALSDPVQEPIAWRFTGVSGFTRYITERKYQAISTEARNWYEPYECAKCRAAPVQGEAVAWARQCDLDESDPAIFVAREEVQESGYLVPLYATPPQPAEVGVLVEALRYFVSRESAIQAKFDLHGPADIASGMRIKFEQARAALAKLDGNK